MSAAVAERVYSPEDYLAQERIAEHKSEFMDGRIYAMTGASRAHNLITVNLARSLGNQLLNRPCEAYISDMRVKAADAHSYRYPDVAVVCGRPEFEDEHADTLLNPTLLIEVLSPSTEAGDRGEKFVEYRCIPSLKQYILVEQDKPRIERYERQRDGWLLTETAGLDATVSLDAVGCVLALAEVYDKVFGVPD